MAHRIKQLSTITRSTAVKSFQSAVDWRQASRFVSDVAERTMQLNTTRCNAAMSECEKVVDWRRVPSRCRGGHQGAGSGDSSCIGSVCSKNGSRWYEALLLLNCVISGCHCGGPEFQVVAVAGLSKLSSMLLVLRFLSSVF